MVSPLVDCSLVDWSAGVGELFARRGAEPDLQRQRSCSLDGQWSDGRQGAVAVTFPAERGGRGGRGGGSGGGGGGGGEAEAGGVDSSEGGGARYGEGSEGGAAGEPLESAEEPVGELRPRVPPTGELRRTQSHAMPRITLHRRSRSEPPRDLRPHASPP